MGTSVLSLYNKGKPMRLKKVVLAIMVHSVTNDFELLGLANFLRIYTFFLSVLFNISMHVRIF